MRIATIDGVEVRHSAASVDLNPKALGSKRRQRRDSSADTVRKLPGGMTPRSFQLLTADWPTPTRAATAAVPPRASTMSSTDLSISLDNSPSVKMSSLHRRGMAGSPQVISNRGMDSRIVIGKRLQAWQDAESVRLGKKLTGVDLAAEIPSLEENEWSMYRRGKRLISLETADELCDKYKLTLDWIYRGNDYGLPGELQELLRATARQSKRTG